jgi:dTDP-4-amino-4,6-dideoxygalactose transaminase
MSEKSPMRTPFNLPHMTGKELTYIAEAHFNGKLAGDGPFTERCHEWLKAYSGSCSALLTHSCTAALEMSAILLNIMPGDEVIMPSFTFVSTANAFVLRGAVPVFVDIREDTLNLDEEKIEQAITKRTKAIVVVHYAGVACNMDRILSIAHAHNLKVVEDAAQGMMSTYKGRPLGTIGDLGTLSFHETKNVISGEGGALLVNDPTLALRAEIIREKGTDRSQFFRGEVDKYTWQDIGSSFLPGELIAAFLWAQLEEAKKITKERVARWQHYHDLAAPLEAKGLLQRPIVPKDCVHNGHLYYVLLQSPKHRAVVLNKLKEQAINAVFHYVPLHSSPAGLRYGRTNGSLDVTVMQSERLVRLPLFVDVTKEQQNNVVSVLTAAIGEAH